MPLDALITGGLTGFGLIVAIGAQNAYVLRLGVSASNRVLVPAIVFCCAADTVLYSLGVAGFGRVAERLPWLMMLFQVLAIAFLVVYAALSVRRALRSESLVVAAVSTSPRLGTALATVAAFTWLNPHVYLDTLVLAGSIAQPFGEQRWVFALGATLASWVWFFALGFGAKALRPVLARPWTWRVLDALIASVMLMIAVRLVTDLIGR